MRDGTNGASLRSWVESANDGTTDFPVQNLPLGVMRRRGSDEAPRVGVAIGTQVLDLQAATSLGVLQRLPPGLRALVSSPLLNGVLATGRHGSQLLRAAVSELLRWDTETGARASRAASQLLVSQDDAELLLPVEVGDYTDFYASVHHATNVGRMFRPDQPLMPNYKWVPIGYHGRASSLVVSGSAVRRPCGQATPTGAAPPPVGPTARLDYEVEVGFYVGQGNAMGQPIPIAEAGAHLFGICLLNDWSARDIQAWEYQPLGPFLSKSFVSTLSPWVVTMEALEPFRGPLAARDGGDPAPLPYLFDADDAVRGAIAVTVEVGLSTSRMRDEGAAPHRLSRGQLHDMYWTPAQLLAHHSSNGCNMRPGDLLGSGTISGPTPESRGCLLELTKRGTEPLTLPNGETRRFLEDGDEVVLRGYCEADGAVRIGLGECRGLVLPAEER